MKQVLTALTAMACFATVVGGRTEAQVPKAVSIGFANKADMNVVVIGYTVVNGVKRPGANIPLKKGGMNFENNVPPGIRFYVILDANTLTPVGTQQVVIQNRDTTFDVVPNPRNPKQLILTPPQ